VHGCELWAKLVQHKVFLVEFSVGKPVSDCLGGILSSVKLGYQQQWFVYVDETPRYMYTDLILLE
jgi:hypothetical protein